MPKGDKLTRKQEAFIEAYLKTRNPKTAYKQAFDVKSMSDQQCAVEGNKLLQHPKIALRLRQSHEKVIEKTGVTIESILAELEEARRMAILKENPSAMAQASLGKAKVGGLIVEKREIGGPGEFSHLTDEELDAIIQRNLQVLDGDAIH